MEIESKCVTGDVRVRKISSNFLVVDLDSNSSKRTNSDSGGGSSGGRDGAVPVEPAIPTPPSLSHGGAAQPERKSLPNPPTPVHSTPRRSRTISTSSSTCDSLTQTPYISFSAKTCLELLRDGKLTTDQLAYEYEYFKCLGCELSKLHDLRSSTMKSKRPFPSNIENEMKEILTTQSFCDFNDTVSKLSSITDSISYLAEKAETVSELVYKKAQNVSPVTLKSDTDTVSSDDVSAF